MTPFSGRSGQSSFQHFETIYLRARWILGASLVALTVLVGFTGIDTAHTWAIGAAGVVILAHNFAMGMWNMHDAIVALLVDITAVLIATFIIAEANNDPIPALLTMVGAAVLISLFCQRWALVGSLLYVTAFTLVTLTAIHDGDVATAAEGLIGSAFVSVLVVGVVGAIRKRLVELEAARAQTLGVVSHELRNHLTGVIGAIDLITEEGSSLSSAEVDELLHLSHDQALEAGEVIEDLLVASRAERGVLDSIPEVVDLAGPTETVIRRTALDTADIVFDSDGAMWAMADPLRYKQIMRNLLTNALRYGGDTIRVSMQRRESRVYVLVADNGDGVDPANESAIFQAYRGGRAMKGVSGSTGLGLWISRSLAHKMGGDLHYRREGDQTVFELTLPAADEPSDHSRDHLVTAASATD